SLTSATRVGASYRNMPAPGASGDFVAASAPTPATPGYVNGARPSAGPVVTIAGHTRSATNVLPMGLLASPSHAVLRSIERATDSSPSRVKPGTTQLSRRSGGRAATTTVPAGYDSVAWASSSKYRLQICRRLSWHRARTALLRHRGTATRNRPPA